MTALGFSALRLKYDELLSNCAFNFNLRRYPTETLWITNEIIHNPTVNKRLADMGVKFIEETKTVGLPFHLNLTDCA